MELPGVMYKLQCISGFTDGNVYPRAIRPGETVIVDGITKTKLLQSDPEGFTPLGMVIPPPTQEVSHGEESTSGLQEGASADSGEAGNKSGKSRGNTSKQKPVSFTGSEEEKPAA